MFRVGQKVVCVDDSNYRNPHLAHLFSNPPVRGRIYTVRGITAGGLVLLKEIENPPYRWRDGFYEPGYLPFRFRPIDDLTAELAQTELSRVVEEKPEHLNIPQHA